MKPRFDPSKALSINLNKPIAGRHVEEIEELGDQILKDQMEWIDAMMKEHLPVHEYDKIVKGQAGDEEIAKILHRYGIRIVNNYQVFGLNLEKYGRTVAQFKAQFQTEDGQKIYPVAPTQSEPDPHGDSLWPDKDKPNDS